MFSQLGVLRGRGRPARACGARSRRRPAGRRCPGSAAVVIASIGDDQLRRRPGGGASRARSKAPSTGSPTAASSLTSAAAAHRHDLPGALLRRRRRSSTCSACGGCATVRGAPPVAKLRTGFAHTLIPIAFAYLVAHYFSLFVFQEQAQFTYLLSDPLGTATTDLFGTASGGHRLHGDQRQRDLVRAGRRPGDRPRGRPHPRPRPRDRLLGRLPPGRALAVLDAGGDGRLHLLRPLPALGRPTDERGDCGDPAARPRRPLALGCSTCRRVAIVVFAIVRTTIAERRKRAPGAPGVRAPDSNRARIGRPG